MKDYRERSYKVFKNELKPIRGIHDLIAKLHVPFCVVIEDSAAGIRAALAGDFKVYALAGEKKKSPFEQMGAIPFF